MAGSTIGTNIVTDGSTEYELLKALLSGLAYFIDHQKDNEYAKNLKDLVNHLNGGGKLEYKLVENKYVKELEKGLKEEKIPYILMPNENGETAIAIRDKNTESFLDIQQRVFSRYTDYWKEQAVDNIITNVKEDPEFKRSKIPVLSFEDNAMRLIAAQKLYGNNVVTGYKDGKTIIHPTSVYNKGGDLIDAQLDMAMEQCKGDGIKDYDLLSVRKAQAKYDQEMLSEFCKAYKSHKSISLWDAQGRSTVGLSINQNGDIELCTPKEGYAHFAGEESIKRKILVHANDNINETELFGMLSKEAGKIYNTVCCTTSERNNILSGIGTVLCNRPVYSLNSAEQLIYNDISGKLQIALDAVKAEAYSQVEKNGNVLMSKEEKSHKKEEVILDILTTRNHPQLQAWLDTGVITKNGDYILTRVDKERMLDKLIEHFKDNHENSRDEMRINYYSANQLSEIFKDSDKDINQNKESERENENRDL